MNEIASTNTFKTTSNATEYKILTVKEDGWNTSININAPLVVSALVAVILTYLLAKFVFSKKFDSYNIKEVIIKDPFSGSTVKIMADNAEKKIAHKIWTELVTRKAAIPIEDMDVIVEVYDSWYSMFGCIRQQIAEVPVEKLRNRQKEDIEKLIDISTKVLNEGLRPHLTRWQADYRCWYENETLRDENKGKAPQQIQCNYSQYSELFKDMKLVNSKLIDFAEQLKVIIRA